MSQKLKLGPLPDVSTVRLTITVPTPIKVQLDQYAEAHSQAYGVNVDAATLIPLMLVQFLARDKLFQRTLKTSRAH